MYQSDDVKNIMNIVNFSPNKSTASSDYSAKETYIAGDAYFNSADGDFPYIPPNSPIDVRANIVKANNNLYYPYVYIRDKSNGQDKVIPFAGSTDLNTVLTSLKNNATISALQAELYIKK